MRHKCLDKSVPRLQLKDLFTAVTSASIGVAIYICDWIYPYNPPICALGLKCTLAQMYIIPLLIAVVLGIVFSKRPFLSWSFFMLPSLFLREITIVSGGGNLWPLFMFFDITHALLVAAIIWGVATLCRIVFRNRIKS